MICIFFKHMLNFLADELYKMLRGRNCLSMWALQMKEIFPNLQFVTKISVSITSYSYTIVVFEHQFGDYLILSEADLWSFIFQDKDLPPRSPSLLKIQSEILFWKHLCLINLLKIWRNLTKSELSETQILKKYKQRSTNHTSLKNNIFHRILPVENGPQSGENLRKTNSWPTRK